MNDSGGIQRAPNEEIRKELEANYKKMAEAGLLPDDAEQFDDLMKRCKEIETRAN